MLFPEWMASVKQRVRVLTFLDIPVDMPTQHNSPIFKDDFPKLDAASIRILRHAGALIFGECPSCILPVCRVTRFGLSEPDSRI